MNGAQGGDLGVAALGVVLGVTGLVTPLGVSSVGVKARVQFGAPGIPEHGLGAYGPRSSEPPLARPPLELCEELFVLGLKLHLQLSHLLKLSIILELVLPALLSSLEELLLKPGVILVQLSELDFQISETSSLLGTKICEDARIALPLAQSCRGYFLTSGEGLWQRELETFILRGRVKGEEGASRCVVFVQNHALLPPGIKPAGTCGAAVPGGVEVLASCTD
eukprot:CAMPEP_0170633514 /NCGR_PEP_ID=MMETSP0224-20130122/36042_1 /TAXON_ID=285029 /ORGANISM="Togula jolla, Strain CCCM 725" /LENGTH=221 /DNA_ID=CAMNT_0010962579 /DNA_START=61 /DNA_END=728 /DNA_ORIENTATION=-